MDAETLKLKTKSTLSSIAISIKRSLRNPWSLFYFVVALVAVAIGFYAYALFTQWWTTPFGGDYTQQQIPLFYNAYDDWWTFFKTGKFVMWDESLFLGADNIGSNSFYCLFDPFFMVTLLFPRDWIPQIMAIESILKVVVAGLLMRAYLKYFNVKEFTARAFGLAYAVCGWVAFYFWYNTFAEVATFLPLILLGIEITIKERKPYVLIAGLFIEALTNYFFLFTICIFGVLYALFRYFQTFNTRNGKQNLISISMGIGAFALALGMSCFVTIPGYLTAMESTRASNAYLVSLGELAKSGDWAGIFTKVFTYWNGSKDALYYPLISFFYPTMSCRYVTFVTNDSGNGWNIGSSLFLFIPTCLIFFVSVLNSIREKKWSHFIAIGFFLICLFVPFFYYAFHGFTQIYGRWQIICVISIATYCAIGFDKRFECPKWFYIVSIFATLSLMVLAYILVRTKIYSSEVTDAVYNSSMDNVFIYELILCGVESLIIFVIWKKEYLSKVLLGFFALEAIVMGNITQQCQGIINYQYSVNGGYSNVINETDTINVIKGNDGSYYRIFNSRAYPGNDNINLREGYNGANTFHSLYNYNTLDFCHYSHIMKYSSTWIGGYIERRVNLDEFLGVKYYVIKKDETKVSYNNGTLLKYGEPVVPLGFEEFVDSGFSDQYRVFVNKNHIDLGFSYDSIYYKNTNQETKLDDFNTNNNLDPIIAEETYLKGAILNDEDADSLLNSYPNLTYLSSPSREATELSGNYRIYSTTSTFDPFYKSTDYLTNGHIKTTDESIIGGQTVLEITPISGTYFNDEASSFLLKYPYYNDGITNYGINVYLYGDDEANPIMMDLSNYSSGTYKMIRGYYSASKVKRIIIVPKYNFLYYTKPQIFMQPYSEYMNKVNTFKQYPLENVTNGVNEYSFTTNFENNRFIVLQLAYETGWNIKARSADGITKDVKYYNAQGGFVGFMSEKGNTTYEVTYTSKGYNIAIPITIVSFLIFSGTIAGGVVIENRRRKKEFGIKES